MEQLIERIAKAPLGLKIGVVAGALALVTALSYFVFSLPYGPSISEIEVPHQAHHLRAGPPGARLHREAGHRQRPEPLPQGEGAAGAAAGRGALAELPEEKNIDELLQLFQDRAQKAGLEISTITPEAEKSEGFYARIPIPMTVTGNFHEIATFFDSLGRLKRIVNVSDISMSTPREVGGKLVVDAKFLVTTFMFVSQAKAGPAVQEGGGPVNRLRLTALAALLLATACDKPRPPAPVRRARGAPARGAQAGRPPPRPPRSRPRPGPTPRSASATRSAASSPRAGGPAPP